jgi:hypothetical protein
MTAFFTKAHKERLQTNQYYKTIHHNTHENTHN